MLRIEKSVLWSGRRRVLSRKKKRSEKASANLAALHVARRYTGHPVFTE